MQGKQKFGGECGKQLQGKLVSHLGRQQHRLQQVIVLHEGGDGQQRGGMGRTVIMHISV